MSALSDRLGDRLLDHLPGVYRQGDRADGGGALRQLLAAFEYVLLGQIGATGPVGYEQRVAALPSLLSRDAISTGFDDATRDAFVPWLAAGWVAFTPFTHFEPARLRHIVAGVVPLYAKRGTPAYLIALLRLCFDEIIDVRLREHLDGGLRVGHAHIGRTTLIGLTRPHTFELDVDLGGAWDAPALAAIRLQVRAIVDFAKPAHTVCEITVQTPEVAAAHDSNSRVPEP